MHDRLRSHENVDRGIVVAVEREAARLTGDPAHGQRDLLCESLTAPGARFRCVGWVHDAHLTAGACCLAREVIGEIAPSGIEDACGKVMVMRHVRDTEVFDGDQVVRADKTSHGFVEVVLAPVAYPLVLALHLDDGLLPIAPALLTSGDTPLDDAEFGLFRAIPARVLNRFTVACG